MKAAVSSVALELLGFRARADVEALDLPAVGADEAGLEGLVARRRERRHQRPVFAGDELLDFELAVGHEPQRHRLHPAGRARARQLAPQHRREREAHEIVERAAGQISVDQRAVDLARVLHGSPTACLVMALNTTRSIGLRLQRLLFLEHLEHVPGDRLALAVRVGGQDQAVGAFDGAGDVVQPLLGLVVDLPEHLEIVLRIDRAILGRQVADMAERSQNLVAGARYLLIVLALAGDSTTTIFIEFQWVGGELQAGKPAIRAHPTRREHG